MGRQSGNTFRTTISVSLDLKERMDAAAEEVNWSAVACRAFEEKLTEIATRKREKTMKDTIQRLRTSKLRSEDARFKQGNQAGRAWAKKDAEAEQLQRLQAIVRSGRWDEWFVGESAYSWGDLLLQEIDENTFAGRNDGFWVEWAGDESDSLSNDPSFVKGFAEGAVELWEEVENEI